MTSLISLITPKKQTAFMSSDSTVRQALERFDVHKFTIVPLVDSDGHYCGTLSEGDLLRFMKNEVDFDIKKAEHVKVSEIEHYRPYKALGVEALMVEVFSLSLDQNFIPLVDDNNIYIGIIKRREIIKYLSKNADKLALIDDQG